MLILVINTTVLKYRLLVPTVETSMFLCSHEIVEMWSVLAEKEFILTIPNNMVNHTSWNSKTEILSKCCKTKHNLCNRIPAGTQVRLDSDSSQSDLSFDSDDSMSPANYIIQPSVVDYKGWVLQLLLPYDVVFARISCMAICMPAHLPSQTASQSVIHTVCPVHISSSPSGILKYFGVNVSV